MNKVLIPVLVLAAVGAATFGFIEMSAAGEATSDRDHLNSKLSEQEKALADALAARKLALEELQAVKDYSERVKAERDEAKKKAKELADAAEKNAGLAAAPAPAEGGRENQRRGDIRNLAQNFFSEMDNNPEVRNALKSRQTEGIAKAYAGLFKKLNLSESDSKLVSELLSDRMTSVLDKSRKLLNGQGDEAAQADVKKEIEASKVEYDTKLKGVLGEEKFKQLNTEEQSFAAQQSLNGVSRSMADSNAALSDDQKTKLADIMVAEKAKSGNNSPVAELGGGLTALFGGGDNKAQRAEEEAYQQRVVGRAGEAGLTPDQTTALQQSFKKQNEDKVLMQGFGRAFQGGGRGGRGRGAAGQ
jgi:hypothetical protein